MFANQALFGVGLDVIDEPVFQTLHLEIENLAHWLAPLKPGIEMDDFGKAAHLVTPAEPAEADFGGFKFACYLGTVSFHPYRTSNRTEVRAQSTGTILITSPKPTSFAELDRHSKPLLDLITVASGRASGLINEELDPNIPDGHHATVFKRLIHKPDSGKEFTGWIRFLFTCDDLPAEKIIQRWLELSAKLAPAIGVLLGQVYLDFRSYEATRWGLTCWCAFCSGVA